MEVDTLISPAFSPCIKILHCQAQDSDKEGFEGKEQSLEGTFLGQALALVFKKACCAAHCDTSKCSLQATGSSSESSRETPLSVTNLHSLNYKTHALFFVRTYLQVLGMLQHPLNGAA